MTRAGRIDVNAYRMQRLRTGLWCIVLLLPLAGQTPAKPGRLVIKSAPPDATVIINGQTWRQPTNTTVVVPPGNYTVSVTSDKLKNCQSKKVTVRTGSQTEVTCTEAGWK